MRTDDQHTALDHCAADPVAVEPIEVDARLAQVLRRIVESALHGAQGLPLGDGRSIKIRDRGEVRLKSLDRVIKTHGRRVAGTAQGQGQAAEVFAHTAVGGRVIIAPEQVGLELVDSGKHRHVDNAPEVIRQRREAGCGAVNDRVKQGRDGVPVFILRDRAEEFRHPEIPHRAAIGHREVGGRDLHRLHEAEHVAVVDHVVMEVLFLQGVPGRANAVLITPVRDALREVLREDGPDSLVEVPPHEFGHRVGAPVERG